MEQILRDNENEHSESMDITKFAIGLSEEDRLIFLRHLQSLLQQQSEQEPVSGAPV